MTCIESSPTLENTIMRKIQVAVIGVGMAAAPHLASLESLSDQVEVTWMAAHTPQRLAPALARFPGARGTTQLDDLLADAALDAALVLTPPSTHHDIGRRLADAGKHILMEKPLALDAGLALDLVSHCESAGVALAVMLQHRLRPAAQALRQLLADGELGELVSASVDVRWWRPQSYYDEPGRGTLARDGGGVLMTQAIHVLDLYLSLVGLPEEVIGLARTSAAHTLECEDLACGLLRHGPRTLATLQATTAAYPGYAESIALNGTRGSATLSAGRLHARLADGREIDRGESMAVGAGADPMAFSHDAHLAVISDFVDAVRQGRPPAVGGRSALAVQQLIEALLASSSRGGQPVRL